MALRSRPVVARSGSEVVTVQTCCCAKRGDQAGVAKGASLSMLIVRGVARPALPPAIAADAKRTRALAGALRPSKPRWVRRAPVDAIDRSESVTESDTRAALQRSCPVRAPTVGLRSGISPGVPHEGIAGRGAGTEDVEPVVVGDRVADTDVARSH